MKKKELMDSEEDILKRKKQIAYNKIFEFLSNPENTPPKKRIYYAKIIGPVDVRAFKKMFSVEEIIELENLALEQRRKRYALKLARIDDALVKKAVKGDVPGIKLAYQKFEGWGEKTISEVNNIHTLKLDDELRSLMDQGKMMGAVTVEPEPEAKLLSESIQNS